MLRGALDRQQANNYGIFGPRRRQVGCCFFANLFHLMNHSCFPNASLDHRPLVSNGGDGSWWAPTFVFRAVSEIAAGEEVTGSYTSPTESTAVRAKTLAANYGFKCACRRCRADPMQELDILRVGSLGLH